MNSFNTFLQKINPKVLVVVLLFLIVFILIVLLVLFRVQNTKNGARNGLATPTPIPVDIPEGQTIPTPNFEQPAGVTRNSLGEVTFGVLNLSIPEKLKLYIISPVVIDNVSAVNIASSLNFQGNGKTTETANGTMLTFTNQTSTLSFYLNMGNIQYYLNSLQDSQRKLTSKEALINLSQSFLSKFLPYSNNLKPDQSNIEYLKGSGDPVQTQDFSSADVYLVPLTQTVDNLPIYGQFASSAQGSVWINKSGQVQKSVINAQPTLVATKENQTISLSEAKTKILEGEGVIASYGDLEEQAVLTTPERTILSQVKLAYFKDSVNKFLYPIFVFSGTAFKGGDEFPITVYLPATNN